MARMNAFIHDMTADIRLGDTMNNPRFTSGEGRLERFDIVTANPMWNQDFAGLHVRERPLRAVRVRRAAGLDRRLGMGAAHVPLAQAGGAHGGGAGHGSRSRGSGSKGTNRERDIRKRFVEEDLVEVVILLPENLFYNTSAPGIIMILNRAKRHPGEVLLINGTKQVAKGRPKNYLTDETSTPSPPCTRTGKRSRCCRP